MKINRKNEYISVITYEDPISKTEQISIRIPPTGFDPKIVTDFLQENRRPDRVAAHEEMGKIKKEIGFETIKKRHAYRPNTYNHMGPCYHPEPLDEEVFNTKAMNLIVKIEKLQLEATSANSIDAESLDELVGYSIRLGAVLNTIKMRREHLKQLIIDRKRIDSLAHHNEGRTKYNLERKENAKVWRMAVTKLIKAKPLAFHAKKTREKARILERELKKRGGFCPSSRTIENYIRNLK